MKKIILTSSFIGVLSYLVAFTDRVTGLCADSNYSCRALAERIEHGLFFFVVIFIFSLITYYMSEKTFQAWWRFARVSAPIILILSLLINLEVHHSQNGDLQNIFDLPILITLYAIFILGSTWQIYRNRS